MIATWPMAVGCSGSEAERGGAGGRSGAASGDGDGLDFGNMAGAGAAAGVTADGSGGTGSDGNADGDGAAGSATAVCGAPAGGMAAAAQEICGNGLDDDHNGFVDELCACAPGESQPCFGGRPELLAMEGCSMGVQHCDGVEEFSSWGPCEQWGCGTPAEVCDGLLDEDCDGQIDEGCELDVPVDIDGDCVTASCPAQAPYPVGCDLLMEGGDERGCVANTPGQSDVYFQEGDSCGAGRVVGRLLCSTQLPDTPLDAAACLINKPQPTYGLSRNDCAPTGCIDLGFGCL